MRRIDACVAIAGLAAVIFSTSPAAAFGLRVGPYYFAFPPFLHWHRHHRHYVRATPNGHASPQVEARNSIRTVLSAARLAGNLCEYLLAVACVVLAI